MALTMDSTSYPIPNGDSPSLLSYLNSSVSSSTVFFKAPTMRQSPPVPRLPRPAPTPALFEEFSWRRRRIFSSLSASLSSQSCGFTQNDVDEYGSKNFLRWEVIQNLRVTTGFHSANLHNADVRLAKVFLQDEITCYEFSHSDGVYE